MWDDKRQPHGKRRGPGRAVSLLSLLALSLIVSGCKHQDALENEMRARDFQYRDLLDEMKKCEFHNQALQSEIEAIRRGQKITPETAAQNYGLKRIALGSLTMGINTGKCPGDDALQVIVEPRDVDDHTIKVPGTVQVIAQEINSQGIKMPLSTWDISQDQVRKSWQQGLMNTGYYFKLPWQSWPQYENVRVTVKFVLSDNRLFEADKDIKVRLASRDMRPTPTPGVGVQEPPVGSSESWRPALNGDMRSTPAPIRRSSWQPAPLGDSVELGGPAFLE
jgi:hypothetical protein